MSIRFTSGPVDGPDAGGTESVRGYRLRCWAAPVCRKAALAFRSMRTKWPFILIGRRAQVLSSAMCVPRQFAHWGGSRHSTSWCPGWPQRRQRFSRGSRR
ncbi:hypothetical protein E4U35_003024, partial [Claviceps purpurea]